VLLGCLARAAVSGDTMISYVRREWLGRVEVWAVNTAAPYERGGEPSYPALFVVAGTGTISRCELGRTPLTVKEPIRRDEATALHPELVRRAEGGELGAPTVGDERATINADGRG